MSHKTANVLIFFNLNIFLFISNFLPIPLTELFCSDSFSITQETIEIELRGTGSSLENSNLYLHIDYR